MAPDPTDVSPVLLELLRAAGDEWGPLGVALAAAHLTDPAVVVWQLRRDLHAAGAAEETPSPQPTDRIPVGDLEHRLTVTHRRWDAASPADRRASDSEVEVRAGSADLTEAWRELLSRLPSDVYAALRVAMRPATWPSAGAAR